MVLDLGLIVVILLFGFFGIRKGFVQTLLSFAGVLLALILAFVFADKFAEFLIGTSFGETVAGWATSMLSGMGDFMTTVIPTEASLLEKFSESLPEFIAQMLATALGGITGSVGNMTLAEVLTPGFAALFMKAISFVIIFVGSITIFAIVKAIAKSITSLPIINTFDKILGFAVGIVKGLIFVYVLFFIVTFVAEASFMQPIMALVTESKLVNFMFEHNLIIIIAGAFQSGSIVVPTIS